jgi:hypothetical protein
VPQSDRESNAEQRFETMSLYDNVKSLSFLRREWFDFDTFGGWGADECCCIHIDNAASASLIQRDPQDPTDVSDKGGRVARSEFIVHESLYVRDGQLSQLDQPDSWNTIELLVLPLFSGDILHQVVANHLLVGCVGFGPYAVLYGLLKPLLQEPAERISASTDNPAPVPLGDRFIELVCDSLACRRREFFTMAAKLAVDDPWFER